MKWKLIVLSICISIGFAACLPANEYEKNVAIPNHIWYKKFKPTYEFEISDTVSTYDMFLTMRHTEAYAFSNIWLNIKTQVPGENNFSTSRTEVPLAQENGKWLAIKSMNEIYEHKMSLTGNGSIHFSKAGKYTIQLEQIMRTDPLKEVMSIGIRLEKHHP